MNDSSVLFFFKILSQEKCMKMKLSFQRGQKLDFFYFELLLGLGLFCLKSAFAPTGYIFIFLLQNLGKLCFVHPVRIIFCLKKNILAAPLKFPYCHFRERACAQVHKINVCVYSKQFPVSLVYGLHMYTNVEAAMRRQVASIYAGTANTKVRLIKFQQFKPNRSYI